MVSRKEIEKRSYAVWDSIEQVDAEVIEAICDNHLGRDALTPLEKGKGYLLKGLIDTQPRTAELLAAAGELFVVCPGRAQINKRKGLYQVALNLGLELNGNVVYIGCQEHQKKKLVVRNIAEDLPKYLREAYYTDVRDGMVFPENTIPVTGGQQLPIPVQLGWDFTERFLHTIRADKGSYREKLIKRFDLEVRANATPGLREFIRYMPEGGGQIDQVILDAKTSSILLIHDGDVANMCYLDNYMDAIDRYCAHIISAQEGRFDFTAYAGKPVF